MRSIPIPPSKVGLVIGSKGRNLKRMAQIQGVTSLRISTSGDGCKSLVVIGTAKAFAEVEREVQELTRKRGPSKMHNGYSFQGPYMTLFIGTHRTVFCFGAVNGLSEEKQRVVTSYETSETDALEYELHHLSLDSASSDSKGLMAPSNYGLLTESLQHVLASCRSLAYNLKTYWELTVGITLIEPDSPQVLGSRICHQHSKGFQAESPDLTYFEDVLTDLGYEFLTRKRKTTLHFRDRSTNNNVKVSVRGTETLEDEGEAASLIRKILSAKSCFKALGIKRGATKSEVRHAYRRLSLMVHPDKTSAKGSEAAQTVLNLAKSAIGTENGAVEYPEGIANAFGVDTSNLISALKVLSVATRTQRLGAVSICRAGGSDLRFVLRGVKEVGECSMNEFQRRVRDQQATLQDRRLPLPSSASTRRCSTGTHRSFTGTHRSDTDQSIAAQRYVDSNQSIRQILDAAWATRDGSDMKFRQLEFPSDDYSLTVARHCEEDFWTNGRTLLVRGTVRMEHVLDKGFLPSETSTEEINAEPWDMSDKNASTLDDETTVGLLTDLFKDVDLLLSSLDRYNEIKPRDPRNGRKVVQVTDRSRNRLSTLRRK